MSESPDETEKTTPPEVAPSAPPVKATRDAIRQAFLDSKPNHQTLNLFGVVILLQEPPLNVVLDIQNMEDRKASMALMITQYVYTEDGERVFDEEDVAGILEMPFGPDLKSLNQAINGLLGVTPSAEDKSGAAK